MKLFEMSRLPTTAGQAEIKYSREAKQPRREEKVIVLPDDPELEFFPLQQGTQFLLRHHSGIHGSPNIWFGGTDERPFLVPLKDEPFNEFVQNGRHGFYRALMPKSYRQLTRVQRYAGRRQGDFFVVDLEMDWRALAKMIKLLTAYSGAMHPIQRQILHQLTLNQTRRFNQLKPKELDSNYLIYHLKQLIDGGLVTKTPAGVYALTAEGERYVARISLATDEIRNQAKIVTLLVCRNDRGEYLLMEWARQPYWGMISFPFGKVHLGEPLLTAAERELTEKTGLTGQVIHRGELHLLLSRSDELVLDEHCHVFEATRLTGELVTDSPIGRIFWNKLSKELTWPPYAIGTAEIIRQLQRKTFFFQEIQTEV